MQKFSIERFVKNIKIVLDENTTKKERISSIGELEEEVGVSKGFISRVNKNKRSRLTIEQAVKISELLDIHLLDLMNSDFENKPLNKSMETINQFVKRIAADTQDGDLFWCRNYNKYLENELSSAVEIPIDVYSECDCSFESRELCFKTEQFGNIQLDYDDFYLKASLDSKHTIFLIESKDKKENLIVLKSFDVEDLIAYKVAEKSSLPESTLDYLLKSAHIRSMDVDVSYNGQAFINEYIYNNPYPY